MISKGEWFHKNLNSTEVKIFSCLREGKMILDRKRIFGRKRCLREMTFKKIQSFGLKLAKVE